MVKKFSSVKFYLAISLGIVMVLTLFSCVNEKEELLYNQADLPCESPGLYSTDVVPILQAECVSCHNTSFASGNINLDNFAAVKMQVDNGKLLGSIEHRPGFVAMPQGQGKMPESDICAIRKWIQAGALNN